MVPAFVRTVFTQHNEASARGQLNSVAERLATSFPKAAEVLLAAEDQALVSLACPVSTGRRSGARTRSSA
jgi:hypothetical protein